MCRSMGNFIVALFHINQKKKIIRNKVLNHISWKKVLGLEGSILNSFMMKEIIIVFPNAVSTIMKVSDAKIVRVFFIL